MPERGPLSGLVRAARDSHFSEVDGPILGAFTDDPIATPQAVDALLSSYSAVQVELRWSRPSDAGVRTISHRGFFAEHHRQLLWLGAFAWLDARLE